MGRRQRLGKTFIDFVVVLHVCTTACDDDYIILLVVRTTQNLDAAILHESLEQPHCVCVCVNTLSI